MTTALVLVAKIPRSFVRERSEESAQQLMMRDIAYYNPIGGESG